MAELNTAPLAHMGDNVIDPAGAKAEAFQLKDVINQQQLHELMLNKERQQMQTDQKIAEIFKDPQTNVSTPEGMIKAAAEVTRLDPTRGMQLLKYGHDAASGELEREMKNLEFHEQVQGQLADTVGGIIQSVPADAKGPDGHPMYDRPTIDAMLVGKIAQAKADIKNNPAYDDKTKQMLLGEFDKYAKSGQPITYDNVQKIWADTKQGHERIKAHIDEKKGNLDLKKEEGEIQAQPLQRQHLAAETRALDAKAHKDATETGAFSGPVGELMAAVAARGTTVPAGFRSKAQQLGLYKGLLERYPDKTPDQIADLLAKGQISFAAEKKETQTAAGIAGKVSVAENEIEQFSPVAIEAVDRIPREKFLPINKLLRLKEEQIQDPNLRTLKVYVNSLLNAYDVLAARGGTDRDKRAEAHSLLTTADSPETFKAAVKAFNVEAQLAKKAARAAEGRLPPSSQPGSDTPPPDSSGSTSGAGWSIKLKGG